MNKQFNFQNTMILLVVFILLSLLNTCNSCNTNRIAKQNQTTVHKLDSNYIELKNNIYSKDEFDLRLEIFGYRVSKRMLYDNNYIVRKLTRPDDQMNEYDILIEALQKELDGIKK